MPLAADNSQRGAQRSARGWADYRAEFAESWAASISWMLLLVGLVAVSVISDNIPFGGINGLYAAGGRTALRVFALGVPVALSIIFWAIALFVGQVKFRKSPFLWWVAALFALVVISTVTAIDPKIAVFGSWYSEQGLLMWTLYYLVAFLASQLVNSQRRLVTLLATILGAAVYVGGMGLLEVAGLRPLSSQAQDWFYERGSSTLMNPDFLGTYLVIPTLLGVGLTVTLTGGKRYVAAAGTLVTLASLTFTLTRGAWLGVAVGLVALSIGSIVIHYLAARRNVPVPTTGAGYVPPHSSRYPTPTVGTVALIWVAVLAVVVGLVFVVPGGERIVERVRFTIEDPGEFAGTLSGRLPLWSEMWSATMQHPVSGAGPDNLIYAWQTVAGSDFLRYGGPLVVVNSSHNVYLDLAVEFGLIYAVVFILGAIALVGRTIIALQRSAKAAPFMAWEIVSLPVAAFGVGASFIVGMTVVPILAIAFAVVGATISVETRSASETKPAVRWTVLVVAVLLGTTILTWGVLSVQSALVGNQATSSPSLRIQRNLAALGKAPWRVFPAVDLAATADVMNDTDLSRLSLTKAQAYDRLIATDPNRSLNYYNAGTYYLLQAMNPDRAIELADKSLALQSVNPPALLLRGDALCDLGDYENGLADLAESVRLESSAPLALAWEVPWDVYVSRLVEVGQTDAKSADSARAAFAAFEARFPGSASLETFREQVATLP